MPNSYVSNHIHIVFATKNRLKIISEELQPKLWAYLAGIAKNHNIHAVAVGGIADHVHALVNLGPTLSIAKAVQVLKANSSRWMNEHPRSRFEWQEGYFCLQREPIPGTERYPLHCESEGTPQEDELCHGVRAVPEEAWACLQRLI